MQKLIVPLFAVFLLFVCTALGVLRYIPVYELRAGFRELFSAFALTGRGVIFTLGTVVVIALVAGLIGVLFYGWQFGLATRLKVRLRAAEVRQVERDANEPHVTVAKPGYQIVEHEAGREPRYLHLPPEATDRHWAFHNTVHATAKKPRIVEGDNVPMLGPGTVVELPETVSYFDLLPTGRGDLENLLLGVRAGEGRLEPVTISLYDLFHTVIAASTGWGKSAFANNILAQLATCKQPVELVLIDQQAHGLTPLRNCDRLRYPLLREPGEILGALREIHNEVTGKRSALFEQCDADNLREYNRLADEPLPPVVVAVDEASALLGNKEIATELKRQAWELRKFGVYQILMLTSAKGSTIDTDHRQQFSSKVQMHANDRWQARMLLNAPQALDFPPGRAVVDLPRQKPTEVQTPFIKRDEVKSLLQPAAAPPEMPKALGPDPTEQEARILEMAADGQSFNAIARAVYGSTGGKQNKLIKEILARFGAI